MYAFWLRIAVFRPLLARWPFVLLFSCLSSLSIRFSDPFSFCNFPIVYGCFSACVSVCCAATHLSFCEGLDVSFSFCSIVMRQVLRVSTHTYSHSHSIIEHVCSCDLFGLFFLSGYSKDWARVSERGACITKRPRSKTNNEQQQWTRRQQRIWIAVLCDLTLTSKVNMGQEKRVE